MTYVKWGAVALVLLIVGLGLHWSLPSRDVVRILGTDVVRVDASGSSSGAGQEGAATRDMRLINAVDADGDPHVYRNEDTDWGWPPYFKFDSANLAARAENAISTEDNPRWSVVTHYGWRLTFFSKFPNAVAIRPADGPDVTLIPWFNIAVIVLLAVAVLLIRRRILAFFE